jgi:hypothetical protein
MTLLYSMIAGDPTPHTPVGQLPDNLGHSARQHQRLTWDALDMGSHRMALSGLIRTTDIFGGAYGTTRGAAGAGWLTGA